MALCNNREHPVIRPLKTRDDLRELLRKAVIDDPDPSLDGRRGELMRLEIHPHPALLHHVDGYSWTWSCPHATPAIDAALLRYGPGLQAQYDLR